MRFRDLGYARRVGLDSVPDALRRRYERARVLVGEADLPEATLLGAVGPLRLYLGDASRDDVARGFSAEPLLGVDGGALRDWTPGIDGSVLSAPDLVELPAPPPVAARERLSFDAGDAAAPTDPDTHPPDYTEAKIGLLRVNALLKQGWLAPSPDRPVTVAIVDGSFDGWEAVSGTPPVIVPEIVVERGATAAGASLTAHARHGTVVAAVVRRALRAVPHELHLLATLPPGASTSESRWLGPVGIAWAIAEAARRKADVIVVAMSNALWGMPRYLSRVLRQAERGHDDWNGAVIVTSAGDPGSNFTSDLEGESAALGADELPSQPWVLGVGATDEDGTWYRRYVSAAVSSQTPLGRFGPGIDVSAPGFFTRYPEVGGQILDDTSQACALVGAVAAMMRWVGGGAPADVRRTMQVTASMPRVADAGYGLGSGGHDGIDLAGHNFKLGYGEVNALAATMASFDPVALAFVLASPRATSGVGWRAYQRSPQMLLAQTFLRWITRAAAGMDGAPSFVQDLVRGYVELRRALVLVALHDSATREALLWLARHLAAVLGSRPRALAWSREHDHSTLIDRLEHLLDAFSYGAAHTLGDDGAALISWCERAVEALPRTSAGSVALARYITHPVLDLTLPDYQDYSPPSRSSA